MKMPEEVLKMASDLVPGRAFQRDAVITVVARAILAERERCAAVAIEYDGGGRKNNDVGWALSDVAAAIRQGQAKEGGGE